MPSYVCLCFCLKTESSKYSRRIKRNRYVIFIVRNPLFKHSRELSCVIMYHLVIMCLMHERRQKSIEVKRISHKPTHAGFTKAFTSTGDD